MADIVGKDFNINDLIYRITNVMCKSSAPGLARCGCMEKNVYSLVAAFQDPSIQKPFNVKGFPNAKAILIRTGCHE